MNFSKPLLFGVLLLVVAVMGFILWASSAMGPAPEAFAALRSDEHVTVSVDEFIVFQPARRDLATAFVFYPGGRVDYRSYAAPLRKIAAEGYLVILLPMPLNLAVLDSNAAEHAMAAFPEIRHWVVGGHSLGGVAAATFAGRRPDLEGVVFWASSPANDALKSTDLKVLSVYGTLDMSGTDAFDASQARLPADTKFVVIDGGNHAQFGDYGIQPGDRQATISRAEQQKQAVQATIKFLKEASE